MTDSTTVADAARLLRSRLGPVERQCAVCGTTFTARGTRGKYCSPRCKQVANAPSRAAWWRRKQAQNHPDPV